jgi:hypothetical protein
MSAEQVGPPVENVSGSVPTIGSTRRYNRDPGSGQFLPHRRAVMADGYGGIETVTGTFLPGVRNSAYLVHPDRLDGSGEQPDAPDYSAAVHPARKSHAGSARAHDLLNHVLSCPSCAIGG